MAEEFVIPIDMDTAPLEAKIRRVADLIAEVSAAGDGGGSGDLISANIDRDIASLKSAVALVKEFKAELSAGGADTTTLAAIENTQKALSSALRSSQTLNRTLSEGGDTSKIEAGFARVNLRLEEAKAGVLQFRALAEAPLQIATTGQQATLVPPGQPRENLVLQPTPASPTPTPTPAGTGVQQGLIFAEDPNLKLQPTPVPDTRSATQRALDELSAQVTADQKLTVGIEERTVAEKGAAAAAEETTALYRGQKTAGAFGPSFTTDLERAKSYGPFVQQIDVPNSQLDSLRAASEQARQQGLHQPAGPTDFFLDEQTHPEFTALLQSARTLSGSLSEEAAVHRESAVLYHGTTEEALAGIRANGLTPGFIPGRSSEEQTSPHKNVFASPDRSAAEQFAELKARETGGTPAVVSFPAPPGFDPRTGIPGGVPAEQITFPPVRAPQLTKPLVEQGLITESEANDPAVFRQVLARQTGAGELVVTAETNLAAAVEAQAELSREELARFAAFYEALDAKQQAVLDSQFEGTTRAQDNARVREINQNPEAAVANLPPAVQEPLIPSVVDESLSSGPKAKALVIEARENLKKQYKQEAQALFDTLYDQNIIPINPVPPSAHANKSAEDRARGNGAFEYGDPFLQLDPNSPVRRDKRFFSSSGQTPEDLGVALGSGQAGGAQIGAEFDDIIAKMEKIKELEAAARPAVKTGFSEQNAPFAEKDVRDYLRSQGIDPATAGRVAPAVAFGGSPDEAAKLVVEAAKPIPINEPAFIPTEEPKPIPIETPPVIPVEKNGQLGLGVEAVSTAQAPPRPAAPVEPVVATPTLPVIPADEKAFADSQEAMKSATFQESALAKKISIKVTELQKQIEAVQDATAAEQSLAKQAGNAALAKKNQADRINGEKPAPGEPAPSGIAAQYPNLDARAQAREDARRINEERIATKAETKNPLSDASKDPDSPEAKANARLGEVQETAKIQTQLADQGSGKGSYAESVAQIKLAFERSAGSIAENLLATTGLTDEEKNYAAVVSRTKGLQAQLEAAVNLRLAAESGYAEALASSKRSQAEIAVGVQQQLNKTTEYADTLAVAQRLRAQEAASIQGILVADQEYIDATALAANLKKLTNAKIDVAKATGAGFENTSASGLELPTGDPAEIAARRAAGAQIVVNSQANAAAISDTAKAELQLATIQQRKIVAAERTAQGLATEAELEEQAAVLTREFNREQKLRVAAMQRATFEANKAGLNGPENQGANVVGTRFQQIQSGIASRDGSFRDPTEFLQLGQFLKSRFLTTAGFAVSGIATYAAFAGIQKMVTDSAALEKVLQQVKAEFTALGEGSQFGGFREGILSISRDTGEAGKDVAGLAQQFKGAFGATLNNNQILDQVRSAVQLARVTGISIQEIENSVTGAAVTFGTSVSHVGDIVVSLADRTGVAAKESIDALAAMGVTAQSVGLTIEQTTAIVDVAAKYTGQSGNTIAEGLNRIFPNVGTKAAQIVTLFDQANPSKSKDVGAALVAGDTGKVFDLIGRGYDKLTDSQKRYITELLGGPRNAKIAIDIFEHYGEVLTDVGVAQNSAGRLAASYGALQDTLSQQLARVLAAFKNIGAALLNLGLSDAIQVIAKAIGVLISSISSVVGFATQLNDALGGIPAHLAEVYAGFKLLTTLVPALSALGIGGVFNGAANLIPGVNRPGAPEAPKTGRLDATGNVIPAGQAIAKAETPTFAQDPFKNIGGKITKFSEGIDSEASRASAIIAGAGTKIGAAFTTMGETIDALLPVLAIVAVIAALQAALSSPEAGKLRDLANKVTTDNEHLYTPPVAPTPGPVTDLQAYADERDKAARGGGSLTFNPLTNIERIRKVFDARTSKSPADVAVDQVQERVSKGFATSIEQQNIPKDELDAILKQASFDANGGKPGTTISQDDLKKIAEQGTTDNKKFEVIRHAFLESAKHGKAVGIAYQKIVDEQNKHADLQSAVDSGLRDLPTLQTEVATKSISVNEFVAKSTGLIDKTRALLADAIKSGSSPDVIAALKQSLDAETQSRQQVLDQRIKDLTQQGANAALVKGASANDTNTITIAADIQALNTPGALTSPNTPALAQQLVKAQQQQLQYMADHAATAAQAQKILDAGFKIAPAEAKALEIANLNQLPDNVENAFIDSAKITGKNFDDLMETIVNTKGGIAQGVKVYRAKLQHMINRLKAEGGDAGTIAALQKDLNNLDADAIAFAATVGDKGKAADVPAPTRADAQKASDSAKAAADANNPLAAALDARAAAARTVNELTTKLKDPKLTPNARAQTLVDLGNAQAAYSTADNQVRAALEANAQSRLTLAASLANGDPVKQAQAALDAANLQVQQAAGKGEAAMNNALAAVNNANFQMQQALEGIAQAQAGVAQAMADGNPVKAAQASLLAAQIQAQNAHGAAAQLNALAAEISAQHQLRDALNQLADAQQNIVIALLNAAGDTVGAARATLKEDQNAYNRYLAQHPGATPQNDTNAAGLFQKVITDQASARDALLQKQEGDIQFELDVHKISLSQAAARLQNLLSTTNITEAERQNIERQLYSLKQQLGKDLQFNLPTDLRLPTLYEARRATQGGAGNYNDSRQITVIVNGSNHANPQETANAVAAAVSAPPRFGNRARSY